MNKIIAVLCLSALLLCSSHVRAQSLLASLDQTTFNWDLLSSELQTYEGLKKYCNDDEFKKEVLNTLENLHHYDTIIYNVLVKKFRVHKTKEIEKTLEEIKLFETEYSPEKFIYFLGKECKEERYIEHHKKETIHEIGAESYDGQIAILENQLFRYVKHVTKIVDHIKDNAHHLHLESISGG